MTRKSRLRFLAWEHNKYEESSANSLEQYAIMYYQELKDKARKTANHDEAMWYADIAALLLELGSRYDELRPHDPNDLEYSSGR